MRSGIDGEDIEEGGREIVKVSIIFHIQCMCGGDYVRCGGCNHPANIAHHHDGMAPMSKCPVCGAP